MDHIAYVLAVDLLSLSSWHTIEQVMPLSRCLMRISTNCLCASEVKSNLRWQSAHELFGKSGAAAAAGWINHCKTDIASNTKIIPVIVRETFFICIRLLLSFIININLTHNSNILKLIHEISSFPFGRSW